jgi:hypothetical protein
MEIPSHYKKMYGSFIRLACIMSLFALITGILFQESTRKIPYEKLAPGLHWEAVSNLALLHGHTFLIGVLIPLAVLGMMHFSLHLKGNPISEKTVKWGALLYHIGAGLTVLLLLYKGYHYVLSVRMGQLDFAAIDHSYFGGMTLLRQIVYGLSHTSLAVGLGMLSVGILRSLPQKAKATA